MIYVYALVDDPGVAVGGLGGLTGAPLALFARGRVTAVCTIHDDLRLEASARTLWQHERVTATLMTRCGVAPVRFGTVLAGVDQLEQMLAAHEDRFVAVLARLRGKVELSVRGRVSPSVREATPVVVDSDPPLTPSPPGSGRAYLRTLLQTHADRPETPPSGSLAEIHATLAACAEASTSRGGSDDAMVAAYLVEASGVAAFRRAFMGTRARHRDVRLSLTGPWAPFSFVEDRGMAHV